MSKQEFLQKLASLASECHALACQLDIGDERTEMFEIYNVLRSVTNGAIVIHTQRLKSDPGGNLLS